MTGCVGCHMPEVSPREPLTFANHWIGIYRHGKIIPN
jgi:formate-dependent nitrite reductase cytochrome c552 subunit